MQSILTELNAQYRGEYEEATKRLHHTLKLLSSLLVAITAILAAAVTAYIPACTCKNNSVGIEETIFFSLNVVATIFAFFADILGLYPCASERNFLALGKTETSLDKGQYCKKRNIDNKKHINCLNNNEERINLEHNNNYEEIDLRDYYKEKINTANNINEKKYRFLKYSIILAICAAYFLLSLIIVILAHVFS